jgi:antirestriction protein
VKTATELRQAVYEAYKALQNDPDEMTEEQFDQAYIGEFFDTEELAHYLVDDAGIADPDDFWQGKEEHPLAPYYFFNYAMYGRDLDLNGDVYSVEIAVPFGTAGHTITSTHYFWTNV